MTAVLITFRCPACHTILSMADNCAGLKTVCQKCGQRLLVPVPQPPSPDAGNKTIPGQLAPTRATSQALPAAVQTGTRRTPAPATDPRDMNPAGAERSGSLDVASFACGCVTYPLLGVHPAWGICAALLATILGAVAIGGGLCRWRVLSGLGVILGSSLIALLAVSFFGSLSFLDAIVRSGRR
jgi:hypothetical protein